MVFFLKDVGKPFSDRVCMAVKRKAQTGGHFPDVFDKEPVFYFRNLRKILVRIENAPLPTQQSSHAPGRQGVQIDGANGIIAGKKQVPEKPQVVFGVKREAFFEAAAQSFLEKRFLLQRNGIRQDSTDERYAVAVPGQGAANALHALVVTQVVGNRKNQMWRRGQAGNV